MCQQPPVGWMLIQLFRIIAQEGSCPAECRDWLMARNLDSLGGLIPPLVELIQNTTGPQFFSSSPTQAPTLTEKALLGAIACSSCDPEHCQNLLGSILPHRAAHQAEDWVRAIDFVLKDLTPVGRQSMPLETAHHSASIH